MASASRQSRHLACVLCRDRKVKCDGARPACDRCVKAGETCDYTFSPKASRLELQETIHRLYQRLEETESNQAALTARLNSQCNYTSQPPIHLDTSSLGSLSALGQNNAAATQSIGIQHSHGAESPFTKTPAGESARASTDASMQLFDVGHTLGDSLDHSGSMGTAARSDIGKILADDQDCMALLSLGPFTSEVVGHSHAPSIAPTGYSDTSGSGTPPAARLGDTREWARVTMGGDAVGDGHPGGDAERLLREFVAVTSVAEATQYDIIGLADALAKYTSHFRQSILSAKGAADSMSAFLETLEGRMREIGGVCSRKVLLQARRSREALEACVAYRDRMEEVRVEQMGRADARAIFFRTRYDLKYPLSQQI